MKPNDTQTILDQIQVIRVQLDELEKEVRESFPKEEEKVSVISMAQVRAMMAEKWSQGKGMSLEPSWLSTEQRSCPM